MTPLLIAFLALQSPTFEVASVKPANPANRLATISTGGDTLTLRHTTLLNALARAYSMKFAAYLIDGAAWIRSERYDIVAKAPEGTEKEKVPLMLRALLAERFQLVLRHEKKEVAAYALSVGKGQLRLREDDTDPKDTFNMKHGREAKSVSMGTLTQMISFMVRAPVLDETGLSGRYTFPLEMSAEEMGQIGTATPDDPKLSIFSIVEGLGLKLQSKKALFDVIVVEGGNKVPTEN